MNGDDFYQALMDAHSGLSDEESVRLNARLVLLLANEINDLDTVTRLLQSAKSTD
jgi:hypothetical protein